MNSRLITAFALSLYLTPANAAPTATPHDDANVFQSFDVDENAPRIAEALDSPSPEKLIDAVASYEKARLGSDTAVDAFRKRLIIASKNGAAPKLSGTEREVFDALRELSSRVRPVQIGALYDIYAAHGMENETPIWLLSQTTRKAASIHEVIRAADLFAPLSRVRFGATMNSSILELFVNIVLMLPPDEAAKLAREIRAAGHPGFVAELLLAATEGSRLGVVRIREVVAKHERELDALSADNLRAVAGMLNAARQSSYPPVIQTRNDFALTERLSVRAYPESGFESILKQTAPEDFYSGRTPTGLSLHFGRARIQGGLPAMLAVRQKTIAHILSRPSPIAPSLIDIGLVRKAGFDVPGTPDALLYMMAIRKDPAVSHYPIESDFYVDWIMNGSLPDLGSPREVTDYLDVLSRAETPAAFTALWLAAPRHDLLQENARMYDRQAKIPTKPFETKQTEIVLEKRIADHPDDILARQFLAGIRYSRALNAGRMKRSGNFAKDAAAALVILNQEMESRTLPAGYRFAIMARLVKHLSESQIPIPPECRTPMISAIDAFAKQDGMAHDDFYKAFSEFVTAIGNDPASLRLLDEAIRPAAIAYVDKVGADLRAESRFARFHFSFANPSGETSNLVPLVKIAAATADKVLTRAIQRATRGRLVDNPELLRAILSGGGGADLSEWMSERPPGENLNEPDRNTGKNIHSRIPWSAVPENLGPYHTAFVAAALKSRWNSTPYSENTDMSARALSRRLLPILRDKNDLAPEIRVRLFAIAGEDLESTLAVLPLLETRHRTTARVYSNGLKTLFDGGDSKEFLCRTAMSIALARFIRGDETEFRAILASVEARREKKPLTYNDHYVTTSAAAHTLRRFVEDHLRSAQQDVAPEWIPRLSSIIAPLCWYEAGLQEKKDRGSQTQLMLMHALLCAATDPEIYNRFIAGLSPEDLRRYRDTWPRAYSTARQLDRVLPQGDPAFAEIRRRAMANVRKMPELHALFQRMGSGEGAVAGMLTTNRIEASDLIAIYPELCSPASTEKPTLDAILMTLVADKRSGAPHADRLLLAAIAGAASPEDKATLILKRATFVEGTLKKSADARKWLLAVPVAGLPTDFEARRSALIAGWK